MPEVYGLRLLARPRVRFAVLLVLLAAVIGFRALQYGMLTRDDRWALDFSYYWTAGLHVLRGEPIYSEQQLDGQYVPEGQEGFLYPPPFAVAIAPIAAVFPDDYRAAGWPWALVGGLLIAWSVVAITRAENLRERLPSLRGPTAAYLVAAALVFPPVVGELTVGNVHAELLALLSVAWLGVRRGGHAGDAMSGIAIGAATLLKVFPALLLLWLVATGRWRAAGYCVLAIIGIAAASLPFVGMQAWFDYASVLANMGPVADIHDSVSPTLWLAPYLGFAAARWVVIGAAIAVVVLAARSRPAPASFALAVIAAVLVSPAVFHHYLSILVLPLLLGIAMGIRLRWIALAYFLMWGGQQPALGDLGWVLSRVPQTLGWIVLGGALLVGRVAPSAGRNDLAANDSRQMQAAAS